MKAIVLIYCEAIGFLEREVAYSFLLSSINTSLLLRYLKLFLVYHVATAFP